MQTNKWSANLAGFESPEGKFHLILISPWWTMPDYFKRFRRELEENISFSTNPSYDSYQGFCNNLRPSTDSQRSLLCCRIPEMQFRFQCGEEAKCGDSSISPYTSTSRAPRPPMFFYRCLLAFSPSASHNRRPNGSWRDLLVYFSFTHLDLIESLFVIMGEPDPWGSIINLPSGLLI